MKLSVAVFERNRAIWGSRFFFIFVIFKTQLLRMIESIQFILKWFWLHQLNYTSNFTSWYSKLQNQISCGLVIKTSYEVVKHFRICFSWKFCGFLWLNFRTGGTGGQGGISLLRFWSNYKQNLFHQKKLYAGDTKFSDLPPALNCFNAESNIQINV